MRKLKEIMTLRLVLMPLLLIAATLLLIIKGIWLQHRPLPGEILQAIAVALIVIAVIDIYYESTLTEKYFEKRFFVALNDAIPLNDNYLSKMNTDDLYRVVDTAMVVLSGKERSHPDHGLPELVHEEIVPILGKPYRLDYKVRIAQRSVEFGDKRFLQLKSYTKYQLYNPGSQEAEHEVRFWVAYERFKEVPTDKLYVLEYVKISGAKQSIRMRHQKRQHRPTQEEFTPDPFQVRLAPGEKVEVEAQQIGILLPQDVETFHVFHPIKGITVEVIPETDCEPFVEFFTFVDVGPANKTPGGPFGTYSWHYDGWMLREQGYCIQFPAYKMGQG